MFCKNCGKELVDNAKFCSSCGQPNQSAPPTAAQYQEYSLPQQQYQPIKPGASEKVYLVLKSLRSYSLFKKTTCYIVFMQDKLVLAYLTKERQKAESKKLSQEIKASGTGFFKGSAAMMSYWNNYQNKYYNMSSDQILAEETENMLVYYNSITQFYFRAYFNKIDSDGSDHSTGGKLRISTQSGETLKFTHSIADDRSLRSTLTQLLGNRLKYKR